MTVMIKKPKGRSKGERIRQLKKCEWCNQYLPNERYHLRICPDCRKTTLECAKCDAISNDFPTLVSLPQKENKVENTLEHPSQPAQVNSNPYGSNRKPLCPECYKKGGYEQLGLAVVGQLPGDTLCNDCGRNPASLLINLKEAST